MATQNVKILLRRGLREQLTSDILDTGELGFTTDTNQLFIGIDSAINEVQFDPFINAHAIIQSWLDSDDCPETGLTVDEDLVIRNITDMEKFLSAMHFYTQTVVLNTDYDISVGDTLYQREYIFSDNRVSLEKIKDEFVINPGGIYRIDVLGDTYNATFNFLENTAFGDKVYKTGDIFKIRTDIKEIFEDENGRTVATEKPKLEDNKSTFQLATENVLDKIFSEIRITYTQNKDTSTPDAKILKEVEDYEIDISVDKIVTVTITNNDIDIDSNEDEIKVEYIEYVDWGNAQLTEIIDIRTITDGLVRTVTHGNGIHDTTVVVSMYEGKPYFIKDTSYRDTNDYHFYGTVKQKTDEISKDAFDSGIITINDEAIQAGIESVIHNIFDLENIQNHIIVSVGVTNLDLNKTEYTILDAILVFDEISETFQIETSDPNALLADTFKIEYPVLDTSDGLTTDSGLFKYDGEVWVEQEVTIVDSIPNKEYSDRLNVTLVDGIATPVDTEGSTGDYIMVTSNDVITYWVKHEDHWKMLGKKFEISDEVLININSDTHNIPLSIQDNYVPEANNDFKIVVTENNEYDNQKEYEVSIDNYEIDYINWTIKFSYPYDGDKFEDKIKITYSYSSDDFQFSDSPPRTYTNQNGTYAPPSTRSNGDPLVEGDHYIYTDKDFTGGINLNIFVLSQFEDTLLYTEDALDGKVGYVHDNVPLFNSDSEASELLGTNSKIYGRFSNDNTAMIELRKREYVSSKFWNRYDFKPDRYYFSKNPTASINDVDLTQAIDISGVSQFSASVMGRARRNVEVVTENSFLQLFSDQHLSAEYGYSGMRPSLLRKIFIDTTGTFLRYNKNICTTFFIDYSLKQTNGTRTYIRVGTLHVINGVPHGIEKVKISDTNTEIWQDDGDGIVESENENEFSNINFNTSIVDNNIEISYSQKDDYKTEISYTVKRWTM
jgi:hypothetical protein